MDAVLLAGGRGRRLGPFTAVFPKPLAPVGDMPIIEILLRQLHQHGIDRVHISVGYLGELIEAYFLTRGGIAGLDIRYLRETSPLGTAGPVQMLAQEGRPVLVLNGDLLTTFDFRKFIDFYETRQPALAVAVCPRRMTVDFGVVETSPAGDVTGFREKPTLEHLCSMGINIYSPRALLAIEPDEAIDLPDLLQRMLDRGERVASYEDDCYWLDIGRRDDYERALEEFPAMRTRLLGDADPATGG